MLHKTLYSGSKIDELLEAILHIKIVVNGWVKLESAEDNKIDFNELINPGNFSFLYWINGPTDHTFVAPLNCIVTKEGKYLRQYVFNSGFNVDAYTRVYDISNKVFGNWEKSGIPKGVTVSDTPPVNPTENTIWINNSNTNDVIQYFDKNTNSWKSLNPYDYMDITVYNPDNIEFPRGVYQYIDNKVKTLGSGTVTVDFRGHINDANIHITNEEKTSFDNKTRTDTLLTSIQKITDELTEYIAQEAQSSGVDIPAIELLVTQIQQSLTAHANDTVRHPTAEQIVNWNSKAEKNHTHDINGITISASDVIGNIPLANIPKEAKELQVDVTSQEEMLALTKDQIHNGCFVFIRTTDNKITLYVVVDDTKLGTMDAFICYTNPSEVPLWENIEGKPTIIEDLGLTANSTNAEVDSKVSEVDTKCAETEKAVTPILNTFNTMKENHDTSFIMENLIDLIDYKMQIIKSLISNT